MRFLDLLSLSLRMFKARTMRTLLTILGMSIGIAAILLLVSLGYGLQKTLLERITTSDSLVTLDVTATDRPLDNEALDLIKRIPDVSEVVSAVELVSQGKYDDITLDLRVTGTTSSFFKLNGSKLHAGSFLDDAQPNTIVITSAVASIFGKTPNEMVGSTFSISLSPQQEGDILHIENAATAKTYTVAGVIEGDENIAYLDIHSIEPNLYTHYTQLKVKCRSTSVLPVIRDHLVAEHFLVSSISETVDQANQVFRIIQVILMLFGIIALVVSAIGMFNTMTIALLERTEEIGIMKSIGASHITISLMFIVEATLMGFLGSIVGIIIGISGGAILNSLINLVASRFGGQSVSLFYSPIWFILIIIGFGSFVGFLTGLFPAQKASSIDPLEALRYK